MTSWWQHKDRWKSIFQAPINELILAIAVSATLLTVAAFAVLASLGHESACYG
jgi:hypothetical protein